MCEEAYVCDHMPHMLKPDTYDVLLHANIQIFVPNPASWLFGKYWWIGFLDLEPTNDSSIEIFWNGW